MVELCIIAYVYGYSNFIDDIYEMTGSKVSVQIYSQLFTSFFTFVYNQFD